MSRTIILDGDINAFQIAASIERAIYWEHSGIWTLHSDEEEGIERLDDQIERIAKTLEADEVVVALSDAENFRMDVLPTYKENRKGKRKPLCLPQLRAHLETSYRCFKRPRLEGDDIVGILLTSRKIIKGDKVAVSIDKDMKTVPGLHFNFGKPEQGIFEVTEEEADWFHLYQTLMGDQTDGYSGCPGVGEKKAERLLAELGPTWDTVVTAYAKAKLGEEEALRQARVARILRTTDYNFKKKEPILWQPPT